MVAEDVPPLASAEPAAGLPVGVLGWTTTREAGSFGLGSDEPVRSTMFRWNALFDELAAQGVHRVASATQVHGADVVQHGSGWRGWLRLRGVDGHISAEPGTALVVTVADCTPVFLAHPRGVVAALHAGWRGTAAGILGAGLEAMEHLGCPAEECSVHLGPAICGTCYEVGPEVFEAVTGTRPAASRLLKKYVKKCWHARSKLVSWRDSSHEGAHAWFGRAADNDVQLYVGRGPHSR